MVGECRGFLALGQNQFSDAQQAFQQAVELEPRNAIVSTARVAVSHTDKLTIH